MTHASGNPKHIPVSITADTSHLSEGDRRALPHLVRAVDAVNPIYLKQRLAAPGDIFIPQGTNFYPKGFTPEEFSSYIGQHPDRRVALRSPFTNVTRWGKGLKGLRAIPYSEVYPGELAAVIGHLGKAAELISNDAFAAFLRGRNVALLLNGYNQSDRQWVGCDGTPFELWLGPYDSDDDKLLELKRSFEAVLGIFRPSEKVMVEQYQAWAGTFEQRLAARLGYKPYFTPRRIVVFDEIAAGGGTLYGFIPMAAHYPNDRNIRTEVGSKLLFIWNVMEAKYRLITAQLLERAVATPRFDALIFQLFIAAHEICHGLGFRFEEEDFGELRYSLNEALADVFGILLLYFWTEQGIVTKEVAESAAILCIADGLREIRFGSEEVHGKGSLAKYNWFLTDGSIRFDGEKIVIERDHLYDSFNGLGTALFELCRSKDRIRAQAFLDQWGSMPDGLLPVIRSIADVPEDIDPIFAELTA